MEIGWPDSCRGTHRGNGLRRHIDADHICPGTRGSERCPVLQGTRYAYFTRRMRSVSYERTDPFFSYIERKFNIFLLMMIFFSKFDFRVVIL
jgi:hypothetical protein